MNDEETNSKKKASLSHMPSSAYGMAPTPAPNFYGAQQTALQQWFESVDTDKSGRISPQELQRALALGGLNFSMKLASSLIRMHDVNGSNTLDFHEFVALHTYLQTLQQTFATCDRDRSGKLNLQQVQDALRRLGFDLDMQPEGAFYKLVQSYDFHQESAIVLDSFIAMCIQLRNAQRVFNLFDAQRTGRITLDFNQFVWSAAQL
jgi:Ca2+-binding EF-hand superfamily protein